MLVAQPGQLAECETGSIWRYADRGTNAEVLAQGQMPEPQLGGYIRSVEVLGANKAVYGARYAYVTDGKVTSVLGLVDRKTLEPLAFLTPEEPWQTVLTEDAVFLLAGHSVEKWTLDGFRLWRSDLPIYPASEHGENIDSGLGNGLRIILGDRGTTFVADWGVHALAPDGQLIWSWISPARIGALAFSTRGLVAFGTKDISVIDTGGERLAREGWPWKTPNLRGNPNYLDRP